MVMPYCGDHFLMHMNIESLCCTPEIQYYIPIIIQEKKIKPVTKKERMKSVPLIAEQRRKSKCQFSITDLKINRTYISFIFIFIKSSEENKIFALGHLESTAIHS